ncbi:MAG: hypothetical protein P1R58_13495, partial [bacterium]|nr:hypothetical protein [bacterium]
IAIAGGVDTFNDLYILASMDSEQRVNSAVTMDGFVPGEGAGFVLLASPEYAAAAGLESIASILATAEGSETGHMYSEEPYRGEGLALTVQNCLSQAQIETVIPTVYSSMNGENHFAKEWGVAYMRSNARIAENYRIEHPADCIGDTGAACGPIMIVLAAIGFRDNNLKSPALIYASSDTAARTACLLSAD